MMVALFYEAVMADFLKYVGQVQNDILLTIIKTVLDEQPLRSRQLPYNVRCHAKYTRLVRLTFGYRRHLCIQLSMNALKCFQEQIRWRNQIRNDNRLLQTFRRLCLKLIDYFGPSAHLATAPGFTVAVCLGELGLSVRSFRPRVSDSVAAAD